MLNKHRTTVLFFTILSLLTISNCFQITNISADFNIKEGDTFSFEILKIRTMWDYPLTFLLSNLELTEGAIVKLTFTDVDPPIIQYELAVGTEKEEYGIFTDIFVQNRNWDELTALYESQGYEIEETSTIWSLRLNSSMVIKADYYKKDGVLNYFYLFNYTLLVDVFRVATIEFERVGGLKANQWIYSFFVLVPLPFIVWLSFYIRKRYKLKKERERQKLLEYLASRKKK
ncbi:MAG: hypothetical protein FK734_03655 [Asgard group archaeon]|nr:hypothetical protein [Asgard group archaeon]